MNIFGRPTDGDTKRCPQCRDTLVFGSRYVVLAVGMALTRKASDVADRVHRGPGWVCRNGGCDYRELGGDA